MSDDLMSTHYQYAPQANELFERVWWQGVFARLIASLRGRSSAIALLGDHDVETGILTKNTSVYKPIRLENVVGSAGSLGFDADFRPLTRDDKDRWVSAAIALMADPSALPPIHVVEVNGHYFVVDGHHRVSAAKALKRLYIDAEVVCRPDAQVS
ncbi:MAG: ParB-like nuclease domain-containing protein [Anaerolineae bacterium]|nr:ParB-like nuclease domain-containing protein [Anaerolineae bacterium]